MGSCGMDTKETNTSMTNRIGRLPNLFLVCVLSASLLISAEAFPQSTQSSDQSQPTTQVSTDDANKPSTVNNSEGPSATTTPSSNELPDAPSIAQPVQQSTESSSIQPQNPGSVPSGAAGAKAPTVRGAPASRTVGAAIAPAKQRQSRSLLIKVGLVAGACVAVGSAFALSKGSPSKPPGAP
jgi:cytoskeletal protein RodZ